MIRNCRIRAADGNAAIFFKKCCTRNIQCFPEMVLHDCAGVQAVQELSAMAHEQDTIMAQLRRHIRKTRGQRSPAMRIVQPDMLWEINDMMGSLAHKGKHKGDPKGGRGLAFKDIKEVNSAWRSVLYLAKHRKCVRGEYIQQGKYLMFLDRGSIRVTHQSIDGAEKILWYIREGCIFGESEFFDALQAEHYWLCMTACSVYAFSPESIRQISKERPDLLLNLLQSMARKLKSLGLQASSLCLDSVLVRICKFLSQRVVPDSSPLVANIGVSRQEMANLLGVHRVSLYRVLRQQEERGLFGSVTGQNMTILQPHEFYHLAGM